MQSVGVAGVCSSLICLTVQLVVVLVTTETGLSGFWLIQSPVVEISSSSSREEKSGAVIVFTLWLAAVFSALMAFGT